MPRSRQLSRLAVTGLLSGLMASFVVLPTTAGSAIAAPVRYEAEQATVSQAAVESNHAGFTGTGFVNYNNVTGSYVEWTITAAEAGDTTLSFRYANGTSATRPLEIQVNGSVVGSPLTFPGTGSWTAWQSRSVQAALTAGSNTIRATATTSDGGPNVDSLTVGDQSVPGTDWSRAVVDSTMARYTPNTLGGWSYTRGLYLYGQYLVYKRTGERKYFDYIKAWVDRFVDSSGNISNSFNHVDSMRSATLLLILHQETGQARYKTAADKLRKRFNTYPRTSDGGMWHGTGRVGELWADGVYMAQPFIATYQKQYNENPDYGFNEATKNMVVYFSHLQASNGLLWHAYDEDGSQSWSNRPGNHSAEHWARAIGWFGMAAIDILEVLPANHPRRQALINIVRHLARGYARYQDQATGRWFQVVDKGTVSGNWTETSASSMYTFMLSRGVERGYIDTSYASVAAKGYQGVLAKVSVGSDGRTNIRDISEGTNVGDLSYYLNRPRNTNDFHGLGAFLIMNEQLSKTG